MPKVLPFEEDGKTTGYMIMCPACGYGHLFTTVPGDNGAGKPRPVWTFVNGDVERPTFVASMLVRSVAMPPVDPKTGDYPKGPDGKYLLDARGRIAGTRDTVCHSHVRDGKIQFLGDCTHELAGKTVDLPDWNTKETR
jgi:hypothetical protein